MESFIGWGDVGRGISEQFMNKKFVKTNKTRISELVLTKLTFEGKGNVI